MDRDRLLQYANYVFFAALCKMVLYNALETISIFSFAKLLLFCAKSLLLICAKRFYNALETISIFSFAKQMMLREFGDLKGFTP